MSEMTYSCVLLYYNCSRCVAPLLAVVSTNGLDPTLHRLSAGQFFVTSDVAQTAQYIRAITTVCNVTLEPIAGAEGICDTIAGAERICDTIAGAEKICDTIAGAEGIYDPIAGAEGICDTRACAEGICDTIAGAEGICGTMAVNLR